MSVDVEPNPLLAIHHPIRFDRIRAEHVESAIDRLLAESRERLAALEQADLPLTYEATLLGLEESTLPLERAMTVVGHLESVATTPALRAAYNAVQLKVSALMSSIPLSPGLFRMLQAFSETEQAKALDATRARFLSKTLDWFKREGAGLSREDKLRLEQLNVELTEITTRFAQHVLDSTNAYELLVDDLARLSGLPERAIHAARVSAEQKGKPGYRFTLQAPSYIPLLTYAHDRALREQAYRAMNRRAAAPPHDNSELVARILELRREKARLLGYANFVDLVLHDRMAHDGARASGFIADLEERTRAAFAAENAALQAFADATELRPWDIAYYAEKQRLALYDFDEEELRPFFPLESVLSGLFGIVQRLYGIVVEELRELPVWHPNVRSFQIRDADGSVLGFFYADFFPREQKRDGAWMNAFLTGEATTQGYTPHVGLISANVTPPLADAPALLGHREVETVFHEFGHLLHHMLSRVAVRSLAGTNVAWDFVELPSQIMENFCWEREALDLFARHYRTGEAIPDVLYEKLRRARTYRGANDMMRQLGFATLDLELHSRFDAAQGGDVVGQARSVMSRFAPAPLPADYAMVLGFSHLFAHPVGYAGGYYSYKWAEVLDADAFSRFAQEGVFSERVGHAFRERILARGDSRDPMDLFKDFMGREPDLRALLLRSGIGELQPAAAPASV
jgi:oligopeptidase A